MLRNRSEELGDNEKCEETIHKIEQESGYFFNMKYFEEKVLAGDWDEVEKYLSGFTNVDDNRFSRTLYFGIRLRKYFEALLSNDKAKAAEILVKDLKVLTVPNMYKQLTHMLTLDNYSQNKLIADSGKSMRTTRLEELKMLIEANPAIQDKLGLPTFEQERLKTLIGQSLNWQHANCQYPRPTPHFNTILEDHMCTPTNHAHVTTQLTLQVGAVENPSAHSHSTATAKAPNTNALEGSMINTPQLLQREGVFGDKQLNLSSPAWHSPICKGSDSAIDESRTLEDRAADEGKLTELTEIVEPSKCRVVTIPASVDPSNKVARILYTNSGRGILALGSNGIQKLWSWNRTDQTPSSKATASIVPQQYQSMTNDVSKVNLRQAVPCIALSRTNEFIISSCGGSVSLFSMKTLKALKSFMQPPPTPIFLAFYPKDDNIVVIGMSNIDIYIYNVSTDEVKATLRGHQWHITGLAFSTSLNILVSSSGDDSLTLWNTDDWTMRCKHCIHLPEATTQFKIEFHPDQVRLLVFCETVLAMYDVSKWKCIQKWVSKEAVSASLSCATCSSDGQVVYAAFVDGNVGVFDAESLRLIYRIAPPEYLPSDVMNSQKVAPVAIAANPDEPCQFALGMTDGTIRVVEPYSEPDGTFDLNREPD